MPLPPAQLAEDGRTAVPADATGAAGSGGDDVSPRVLWEGAPQRGAYTLRLWWPAAAIGAAIGAFGALWEYIAFSGGHGLEFAAIGIVFVAVAGYGLVVRLLLLWRASARIGYRITAVAVEWLRESRVLPARDLPQWVRVRGRGGDDIAFLGTPPKWSPWGIWRLYDSGCRFFCLSPAVADAAVAALEELEADGVTMPRAWARDLVTPQSRRYPGYDPQPQPQPQPQPPD
jgi:hypothetical protein